MDFFKELFSPGSNSIASTLMLYSFVIAVGIYLGKRKLFGISLGVTFVLFIGIVMGSFGYCVDENILKFIREFGLILFIVSIGLQVGPVFFSSFIKGGMRLHGLAVLSICISVVIVIGIYFLGNVNDKAALVGIMSGAVTNTPGLAAAQQTISELTGDGAQVNTMAQGYAATYPLGVVGIIAAMLVIRSIFRIKVDKEVQIIEEDERNSQLKPYILTLKDTNALV